MMRLLMPWWAMSRNFKIIILVITTLMGGNLIHKYTLDTHDPYVRYFHTKECFKFFNNTTNKPDGHITSIGETEYTIMWSREAARKSAAVKMGYKVPIKWLDQYAMKTPCPWNLTKGGTK